MDSEREREQASERARERARERERVREAKYPAALKISKSTWHRSSVEYLV
jgi:hypothetical protein